MNAGYPRILENLENSKFIFQVQEEYLNFTKSGEVLKKNIAWDHLNEPNKGICIWVALH